MHVAGDGGAILARVGFRDQPRLVLEQGRENEPRPHMQHVDQLATDVLEAPGFVGGDGQRFVAGLQGFIEVDHALDEAGGEEPHAAEVEHVDAQVFADRVVAEMRITVDDAEVVERHVPGAEHVAGHGLALIFARL